ncbi:UNVERIFIED_CONTAM: hypothetical protein Sindi_2844800, partial [Sesamum indicum]
MASVSATLKPVGSPKKITLNRPELLAADVHNKLKQQNRHEPLNANLRFSPHRRAKAPQAVTAGAPSE